MNTAVKIKSCSRASASGKNSYNLERQKEQEKDILVLEENEMPPLQTLSLEDKKEIKSLQTKISTYSKRLEKAIEENKPKSIATNQKNIEEAQKKLDKFERRADQREKKFTEFTIALTNSSQGSYKKDWSKESLEYVKKKFPDLQIISAVEHRDQHSPHMHILLYSKDEPITQVLARSTGQKDTSRESMKEAYSIVAHDFHSFANTNIALKGLERLQKGRKYVSLGQFKQKGNYEAQKAIREQEKQKNEDIFNIDNINYKLKKTEDVYEFYSCDDPYNRDKKIIVDKNNLSFKTFDLDWLKDQTKKEILEFVKSEKEKEVSKTQAPKEKSKGMER